VTVEEYFALALPIFFAGVAFSVVVALLAQLVFGCMRTLRETFGLGRPL
jgi:hypothetical protein